MVKEMIHIVLNEHLSDKEYNPDETTDWTKAIADNIKTKLKGRVGKQRFSAILRFYIKLRLQTAILESSALAILL